MKWHDTTTPWRDPRSCGTGSTVVEHPAGFRVRTRGDTTGTIEHEYECPEHGRFRAAVPRVGVPDAVACQQLEEKFHSCAEPPCLDCDNTLWPCGRDALWVPPLVGIGFAAGEVKS